jgi:Uma2 family endonuclease
MEVKEPDLSGSYTYSDYLSWRWSEMVELIQGKIYKMSAPTSTHQTVTGELFRQIANHLKGKKCKVFVAPFDVRLPKSIYKKQDDEITTVVQPDICVICNPTKIDEKGCLGAPDWIIEILSKNTSQKDLREKFEVYQEAGVYEYWIVHPNEQTVFIYLLESGKYKSTDHPYVKGDKVASLTLPELEIDLGEVFENP